MNEACLSKDDTYYDEQILQNGICICNKSSCLGVVSVHVIVSECVIAYMRSWEHECIFPLKVTKCSVTFNLKCYDFKHFSNPDVLSNKNTKLKEQVGKQNPGLPKDCIVFLVFIGLIKKYMCQTAVLLAKQHFSELTQFAHI